VHAAKALEFRRFGSANDPLVRLEQRQPDDKQARYLRCYLHDLSARSIVVEPNYFDRDYLSEFAAFYATTAAGYPNICQRLHFFSCSVTRPMFARAVGGDARVADALNEAYLGHVIVRPIPGSPFGRTVLRTYPDDEGERRGTPRIMEPWRWYESHVAGLTLRVRGLAWQQQDSAVGSCATVALWSLLHSSAFDAHHAIPTTAEITSIGHATMPDGRRVFPADDGLYWEQMLEVVKGRGLAPMIILGDRDQGFSRRRFCTLVASFIRSGYPVLVYGPLEDDEGGGHTVCLAGFRSPTIPVVPAGCALADENIDFVYLHDDNLGPNARFQIQVLDDAVQLVPRSPDPRNGSWPTTNPALQYHPITPQKLAVAVHQELRTDPVELQKAATKWSDWLPGQLGLELGADEPSGMLVSSRFIRIDQYLERELRQVLRERGPGVLAKVRFALWEKVSPMSLHVGLVRVSDNTEPMMDILFDTSDSNRHIRPTATILYHRQVGWLLQRWRRVQPIDLGHVISAW
jgi:hypothetical protein